MEEHKENPMKYGKPYVLDKRKPENAEEILKKDWKKEGKS